MLTQEQMSRVDGRLCPKQASSDTLVPLAQQKGSESDPIGSPKGIRKGLRDPGFRDGYHTPEGHL